ncbi:MAG TPA: DUF58 domain-containing protein [Bryobacteraceae bacterium]|jgi:uncharacterized protein (DUF58 family)|nr:DUF58 domain-containing protein [Bryobacteraceae bacterium]
MSPLAPSPKSARAQFKGRMSFAFGTRLIVAILVGLIWLIPAWNSPRFLIALLVWDIALLGAWAIDLFRLPRPEDLQVRRVWNGPLSLGEPASATLELSNSAASELDASIIDEIPPLLSEAPPAIKLAVPARGSAAQSYTVRPLSRGDIATGRAYIRYGSPLGFARRWAVADVADAVRVLPDLAQARSFTLYLIRSRQVEMEKRRRRQRGQGRDFEALREYRPGDDLRDICWTASARRSQLTTRVYQVERSQAVWIVLDAGRLMRTRVRDPNRDFSPEKLDYAVDAALSLAQVASHSGDRVGLLAYGRNIQQSIPAGRGPLQVRHFVDALSQVHSESAEANHARAVRTLLNRQTRRSLIVWLTDFAETATTPEVIDYAAHMTRRHLVVFAAIGQPDLAELTRAIPQNEDDMFRHAAALEIAQRRRKLLRMLRDRGVLVIDITAPGLSAALVNQYLDVKDRNLI